MAACCGRCGLVVVPYWARRGMVLGTPCPFGQGSCGSSYTGASHLKDPVAKFSYYGPRTLRASAAARSSTASSASSEELRNENWSRISAMGKGEELSALPRFLHPCFFLPWGTSDAVDCCNMSDPRCRIRLGVLRHPRQCALCIWRYRGDAGRMNYAQFEAAAWYRLCRGRRSK